MRKMLYILLAMLLLAPFAIAEGTGEVICPTCGYYGDQKLVDIDVAEVFDSYHEVHVREQDRHAYFGWCQQHQRGVWQFKACPRNELGGCSLRPGEPAPDKNLCPEHQYQIGEPTGEMEYEVVSGGMHEVFQIKFALCWSCGDSDSLLHSLGRQGHTVVKGEAVEGQPDLRWNMDEQSHEYWQATLCSCIYCDAEQVYLLSVGKEEHQWETDENGEQRCKECAYKKKAE